MSLSKLTASTLIDLVENKLTMLQIGDREDLREVLTLQRCLGELRTVLGCAAAPAEDATNIPRRGRHRKLAALMADSHLAPFEEKRTA